MPLSDEVRNLLSKYIAGETNEVESEKVENWLASNPDVFDEFEQLWDLWYAVGTATNVCRFNVDKGWESVLHKKEKASDKKGGFFLKKMIVGSSVAAALVILVVSLFWFNHHPKNRGDESLPNVSLSGLPAERQVNDTLETGTGEWQIKTGAGERRRVVLPDGSLTWLNVNTTIRFTTREKKHARTLFLKGEAFFDIKHDAKNPFIVRTEHAVVQVLGTRFDVTAYPGDTVTEAILTTGSILFTTQMKNTPVSRHLAPGEKISINHLSAHLYISQVDTSFYTGWKEGKLLFQGETFEEIAKAMEHKYNVHFEFADDVLPGKRLNGYLEKETLTEALDALKLTLPFHYKINNQVVTIYP